MSMGVEHRRFKSIREELRFTQAAFAAELGVKQSTADIERGRTKIPGHVVKNLMLKFQINPLWLYGDSEQKHIQLAAVDPAPKIVTVDQEDRENIVMVNAKAAAGYPANIQDPLWYEDLPIFSIPLPEFKHASFRAFQVEGDSMFPAIRNNEWIVAKAIPSFSDIHFGMIHVVILSDSVMVKQMVPDAQENHVQLLSINPQYQPVTVQYADILELWEVTSKLSFDLMHDLESPILQQIQLDIADIKNHLTNKSLAP